jgi:hypothetical protein
MREERERRNAITVNGKGKRVMLKKAKGFFFSF